MKQILLASAVLVVLLFGSNGAKEVSAQARMESSGNRTWAYMGTCRKPPCPCKGL